MRRLLLGDVHGQFDRMKDALDRSGYNSECDYLYPLGDFTDRGEKNIEVLDFIYSLPNCFPVMGNHDYYLMEYLSGDMESDEEDWWRVINGGDVTVKQVDEMSWEWRKRVLDRLKSTPFIRKVGNNLLVHGGLDIEIRNEASILPHLDKTPSSIGKEESRKLLHFFSWDRSLLKEVRAKGDFQLSLLGMRVFIGHTPVRFIDKAPFFSERKTLVDIDTGSFLKDGCITVLDLDTLDYWQSSGEI